MSRRLRPAWMASIVPAAVSASSGFVHAADKTKADSATRQVEQGAKRIGQRQIGPAFRQFFTGAGQTVVEGAKFRGFRGANVKEVFTDTP